MILALESYYYYYTQFENYGSFYINRNLIEVKGVLKECLYKLIDYYKKDYDTGNAKLIQLYEKFMTKDKYKDTFGANILNLGLGYIDLDDIIDVDIALTQDNIKKITKNSKIFEVKFEGRICNWMGYLSFIIINESDFSNFVPININFKKIL